jgi:hypothetical protein
MVSLNAQAARVGGVVTDKTGGPIPFASVYVKGTTIGTVANGVGEYTLELPKGGYTLVCQHIGYVRQERPVEVRGETVVADFRLEQEQLSMKEIVVRPGGEDPAYAIMRSAIARREYHRSQVESYRCRVYVKGLIRLKGYPKSLFGQRITFDDADTSGVRIVYLSETVADYSFSQPDREKVEVLSTRVSGNSNSFGFGDPRTIDFYRNNVDLSNALNPRGFISPLADRAMTYYRFRYLGAFFEDGVQVSKIEVTPKRTFEPLFSGVVNIVDDEWNIHSLELELAKSSQLELLDRVKVVQEYVPVAKGIRMLQNQTVLPFFKQFGFDADGHFTSVFSGYDIEPGFAKKHFGSTAIRYVPGSNRMSRAYWDSIRPLPLLGEELDDFRRKDSLETLRKDPAYLDSLDRIQNKVTPVGLLLGGQTFSRRSKGFSWSYEPMLNAVGFNTVEGWNVRLAPTFNKDWDENRRLSVTPLLRYGFSNRRLNASLAMRYRFGNGLLNDLSLAGGKRVFQFNNDNPIPQVNNTSNTILFGNNFMKIYEARFGEVKYQRRLARGLTVQAGVEFQSRIPLENTDTTTFWGGRGRKPKYTPNYPVEIAQSNFDPHQAFVAGISLRFRPGTRYIELPDRTINLGSRYPLFTLTVDRGLPGVLGSDVDFTRWRFSVQDDLNLKLAGELRFKAGIGGFIGPVKAEIPDYQHFNGNRVLTAGPYLNTFQLAPYYANSTMDPFFSILHLEHRFNGALTNKIPGIRRLNLRLVAGMNAFVVDRDRRYIDFFFGVDNILKVLRFDYYFAYTAEGFFDSGLKIGIRAFSNLFDEN